MEIFLLLLLSVLPVIILAFYIYSKDSDKEPKGLLIKLFFGGTLSLIITIILSVIIGLFYPDILAGTSGLGFGQLFFHVFFCIALVEEFSKWFVLYVSSYNNNEYDQFFDMIVYSAFVSLGFACFENILYVLMNGIGTAIMRAFLAVPGHFFYGIFMGYYLSVAKVADLNGDYSLMKKNKFLSLFIPMVLHGIYDFCVFSGIVGFFIVFVIFVIALYIKSFKKIKRMARENKKIKYSNNFCPNCGTPVKTDFCTGCGCKND